MNKQIETKEELLAFLKEADIDWVEFKYSKGWGKESEIKKSVQLTDKQEQKIEGLGPIYLVAEYGGEGQGDDYWVVAHFEKFDAYVRVDGYYASHDGGYLDGDPYLVTPKEKTVIVYE